MCIGLLLGFDRRRVTLDAAIAKFASNGTVFVTKVDGFCDITEEPNFNNAGYKLNRVK